jgi:hypothetical protein
MQSTAPTVQLPVLTVAELQDALLVVMHDLQRLEGLLNHAGDNLQERFGAAIAHLPGIAQGDASAQQKVREALHAAVVELQFQDMSSQLIQHTARVVQGCVNRLAAETMGQDEDEIAATQDGEIPDRPNPVTQGEMDAGSVDLF